MPFRGVRQAELGWSVVQGLRPAKPENPPSIGFSDPLWGFVQDCWGGDMKLRPKVAEIVTRLEREATDWDGLMPPCAMAENIVLDSEGPVSDTQKYCELTVLTLPSIASPNGTGGTFPSASYAAPRSPIESQATFRQFNCSTAVIAGPSGPSRGGHLAVVNHHSEEPRNDLHGAKIYPRPESRVPIQPKFEEPHDDLHVLEMYTHLDWRFKPPPSQIPRKKRRDFKHFKSKLRGFFRLNR